MDHISLLDLITNPQELRELKLTQLPKLASDIRTFLIESISQSGGHFASNLGTIELAIALHYVFDTPNDRLIWDVGHQAYAHKLLTGRKHQLHTIRKRNGLTPFPSRTESVYDCFGVGHSSTSISAALGMAFALHAQNIKNHTIAVIGDGAITAGQAFEALNHAGDTKANILVILNDNEMSISHNVGALKSMLTRTLSNPILQDMRATSKKLLAILPSHALDIARKAEEHVKDFVAGGILFEELGFQYFGPIDGHDTNALVTTLLNLKNLEGPKILHISTKKGKGYEPAECFPIAYHAVTPFDPYLISKSDTTKKRNIPLTYTQVFSNWLCHTAGKDKKLMAITPAMREGSGLVEFSKYYPERYFDAAIAEQHAVTLAAGMACEGLKPILAIYSTFLQRGFDQLIHDVALQNLPVLFAVDRAGIVGPDGPTHAGSFDLSYLRAIPNIMILAPSNEQMCMDMLNTAYAQNSPTVVRYPRGMGPGIQNLKYDQILPIGKGRIVFESSLALRNTIKNNNKLDQYIKTNPNLIQDHDTRIAIVSIGAMLDISEVVARHFNASLIDLMFVKPLDHTLLKELMNTHDCLVTIEDNAIMGGAGSAINEWMSDNDLCLPTKHFGLPDLFLEHGERNEILKIAGLDPEIIIEKIQVWLNKLYIHQT